MTVEDWLGEENTLGIDIWHKKYQYEDETFDEWLNRVSNNDEQVKDLIIKKKFLFGGRILSNRGLYKKGIKVTYSNCYVISPPEDNIESIYETAAKLARTYSYGGGCGVDISKLAPRGAKVNNTAKYTSGAVSFMETYSQVTEQIGQNGRRGALMISLDCSHPDLEEFIDVKTDLNKVTKANISVKMTDEFMNAVENNLPYTLHFEREATGEFIYKKIDARDMFKKLAKNNWNYAEPGCLFWDTITSWNLLAKDPEFSYAGVNPCVTGSTLISTIDGEIPIQDLVGTQPYVYCRDNDGNLTIKQASKVWKTRSNAEIVRIHTHRGSLDCTPDHLILTRNRGWVEARDLVHGDKLVGLNRSMGDEQHLVISLSGSNKYEGEHRFIMRHFYDIKNKDVHHIDGDTFNNVFDNLEVLDHGDHSRITNLGHKSYAEQDPVTGRFISKEAKQRKLSRTQESLGVRVGVNWFVDKIEFLAAREDVYDMTVPDVHNFIANRIVVHNCAEEPLPAGGSCCLGSINLAQFVDGAGEFKFDDFISTVKIVTRAMNDILDEGLDLHPLDEQKSSVRDWRQIGIGVMGIADMLIQMRVRYGSSKAVTICRSIAKSLIYTATLESCRLASEKGAYPKCKPEKIVDSEFFINYGADLFADVLKYGLRNSQLLTIAPTGTLSTMLGISGGIEPIFANYYTRKTESLHGEDVYYKVYTPIVKDYMERNNIEDDKDLPDFFITANEIPYKERIAMQAAWQEYIDASISSTVNLPNETTEEDVYNLYIEAWKAGLKGITIFRDGCARIGVLTTSDNKSEEIKESSLRGYIIPASDNLIGLKRKLITGCGSLHCTAFFDPESQELREVYLSKGSTGGCNNFMTGLSRMISLSARGGVSINDIVDQLKSTGSCPSYAVRSATKHDTSVGGCCPMAIANALQDMYKEFTNKDYKLDLSSTASPQKSSNLCPVCKSELTFEGGCNVCKNCGWSKCD